jgi:ArsR family transcriptional regulator
MSTASSLRQGPACCPEGLSAPIDRPSAEALAGLLKAVADPARLQLLSLIASSDAGERCACDLTEPVGLSQPTVSHHLRVLADAGLITREQRGTWAWFSLVPERFAELAHVLGELSREPDLSQAGLASGGRCG